MKSDKSFHENFVSNKTIKSHLLRYTLFIVQIYILPLK